MAGFCEWWRRNDEAISFTANATIVGCSDQIFDYGTPIMTATSSTQSVAGSPRARLAQGLALALAIPLGLLVSSSACAAVVFNVNSTADAVDDVPGNGICHTAAAACTLRAAIMEANRSASAVTINVPAGTYALGIALVDADGDANGDLNLTAPAGGNPVITITGASAGTTIIDAHAIDRIFKVAANRTAVISGVTLRNGSTASAPGGAISNSGDLTVDHSVISHNTAEGFTAAGGGIHNIGTLHLSHVTLGDNTAPRGGAIVSYAGSIHLSDCTLSANHANAGGGIFSQSQTTIQSTTITGNVAAQEGGGIFIHGISLSLDQSTLDDNHALYGGGIHVDGFNGSALNMLRSTASRNTANLGGGIYAVNPLYVTDSTLSGNSATQDGGGIWSYVATNLYNSTVVFNEADSDFDSVGGGAGIYNAGTIAVNVRNSIIAGNIMQVDHAYEDCAGPLNSYGRNKFSNTTNADVINCVPTQIGAGDFSPINSFDELSALQNNGGPTLTHALLPPSDMIDGAAAGCLTQSGNPLATDQRSFPRIDGADCDIGAVEYSDVIFRNGFDPTP